MEKVYHATSINGISNNTLIYKDKDGTEQSIDLIECRDNWYKSHYCKESLIDKILQKRNKCKYVGDRFLGYGEAYFIFYSDIKIKFFFDSNKYMESVDTAEARQCFGYIKELLKNSGC